MVPHRLRGVTDVREPPVEERQSVHVEVVQDPHPCRGSSSGGNGEGGRGPERDPMSTQPFPLHVSVPRVTDPTPTDPTSARRTGDEPHPGGPRHRPVQSGRTPTGGPGPGRGPGVPPPRRTPPTTPPGFSPTSSRAHRASMSVASGRGVWTLSFFGPSPLPVSLRVGAKFRFGRRGTSKEPSGVHRWRKRILIDQSRTDLMVILIPTGPWSLDFRRETLWKIHYVRGREGHVYGQCVGGACV